MAICLECGRQVHARSLCFKHYRNMMRHGNSRMCIVFGCPGTIENVKTGLCLKHYRQHLAEKLALIFCPCGKPAVSTRSGKCYEHHQKRVRRDLQL